MRNLPDVEIQVGREERENTNVASVADRPLRSYRIWASQLATYLRFRALPPFLDPDADLGGDHGGHGGHDH